MQKFIHWKIWIFFSGMPQIPSEVLNLNNALLCVCQQKRGKQGKVSLHGVHQQNPVKAHQVFYSIRVGDKEQTVQEYLNSSGILQQANSMKM